MAQAACFACLSSEAREVLKLQLLCAISSNVISGSGTTNKIPKFTAANAIGNSNLSDDGATVTNGGNLLNVGTLTVAAGSQFNSTATFSPSANSSAIIASGYSLTGNNAQFLVDLSGTWNTTGTPTAFKLNITDTASNASSLLMGLQIGAANRFSVTKAGQITFGTSTATITPDAAGGGRMAFGQTIGNGDVYFNFSNSAVTLTSNYAFGWSSGNAVIASTDTILLRDAAATLAQRNGTTAQSFRVYNTYTDASNYERGVFDWSTAANTLTIGTVKAGTGVSRVLSLVSSSDITFTANGAGPKINAANGNLQTNSSSNPALTNNFICISTTAGAPSGTPGGVLGNSTPIHFDNTSKKIYVWDPIASGWKSTAALV